MGVNETGWDATPVEVTVPTAAPAVPDKDRMMGKWGGGGGGLGGDGGLGGGLGGGFPMSV